MKTHRILVPILLISYYMAGAQSGWKKIESEFIVENPEFKACHASTVVELKPGELMAAWFGGAHEGNKDVVIWTSIKKSGKWSKPEVVATGIINDTLRFPTWNPVLFKNRNGVISLFYKVGPDPRTWWGMVMHSNDHGKSWSRPMRLPDGLLGPIKNKPVQLSDGTILSPSSTESKRRWQAHIERSTDNGRTWTYIPIDTAGTFDVIQPSIIQHKDGRIQVLCRSKQGFVMQAWSSDQGLSWSKLSPTSLINPNAGTDAVTIKSGEHIIVYNPDVPGKEWYNGRSKLHVALSKDGIAWQDIAVLENGTTEEFSYPAVIETNDGSVHITYTYDRRNIRHVVLKAD